MALAAGAAATWLALSYASARLELKAARVALTPAKSSTRAEEALRMARKARAWQPDSGPKVVEWALLYRMGRRRQAQALLEGVVRDEPANADAWSFLAQTAQDPRVARKARRRLRALRPG